MDKRGGLGIVIFFCFLLLAVVVIFLLIFLHGKDELVTPPAPNVSVNKTFFNVTVDSNAWFKINYIVSNGSWIDLNDTNHTLKFFRDKVLLDDGTLFPDKVERFVGAEANATLLLEGFSDDYYYNFSLCNVSFNLKTCSLSLARKANNFSVTLTPSSVVVEPFNGTLQKPIICFAELANVVDVLMSLNTTKVPVDLKYDVDFCYNVGYDITKKTTFNIVIKKNEFNNVSDLLTVHALDYEIKPYKNIGEKIAGIII